MSKKSQSSAPKDLTREQLIAMFRRMLLIRGFEARAKQYFEAREIAGFLHLSGGRKPSQWARAAHCAKMTISPAHIAVTAM
jgi:TPP-dependent pyruvate/acetoin dehydrogenase alpha subunit